MDVKADTLSVEENILTWTSGHAEGQIDLDHIICVISIPPEEGQAQSQNQIQGQSQSQSKSHRIIFLSTSQDKDPNPTLGKIDITTTLPLSLTPFLTSIPTHLKSQIQIIISTKSGTGTAQSIYDHLVSPFLNALGVEYKTHSTSSAKSIISLCETIFLPAAKVGVEQTIILLSGDGGLIDILDVFYRNTANTHTTTATGSNAGTNGTQVQAPNIALIPCGTGNAMANSIGLDGPASTSTLAALLKGKPHGLPVFKLSVSRGSLFVTDEGSGRVPIEADTSPATPVDVDVDADARSPASSSVVYGAVVASWGLHAALVADSDTIAYRRFGSERFKMAAQELLYPSDGSECHAFRGRITLTTSTTTDGLGLRETILPSHEHMYVLATLVPRLEKEFLISPESTALGGKLRFLQFGPMASADAMQLMTLAYQGGLHVKEEGVTYEEVERVRIEFDEEDERWRRVCVDGKIVVVGKGGWVELIMDGRELLNVITE